MTAKSVGLRSGRSAGTSINRAHQPCRDAAGGWWLMCLESWHTVLLSQLSEKDIETQAEAESLRQLAGCPQLKIHSKLRVCEFGVQSCGRAFHTS